MTAITSALTTSGPNARLINVTEFHKATGLAVQVETLADLNALVASTPLWFDQQDVRVLSEPVFCRRIWDATAGHARNVRVGRLPYLLATATNTVLGGRGAPTGGANGDLFLCVDTGKVSLKTAGVWGYLGSADGPAAPIQIYDFADLVYMLAQLDASPRGGYLSFPQMGLITLESPIPKWNFGKVGALGNGCALQCGNLTVDATTKTRKSITGKYDHADYNGYNRYAFAPFSVEKLQLIGPGENRTGEISVNAGEGTSAWFFDGVVGSGGAPNKAIRPSMKDCSATGFDHHLDLGNVAFMGMFFNPVTHGCGVALRHRLATDSGENTRIVGGLTQRTRLWMLLEGEHSEVFVSDHSVDYGIQHVLMRPANGSWARLGTKNCHLETRGSDQAAGDAGYYLAQGNGNDGRCIDPNRDFPIDVDGSGSHFYMHGGLADQNTTGDAPPPWTQGAYGICRHKNSKATFRDVGFQSMANLSEKWWTGPGSVQIDGGQYMFPGLQTMPGRISDNPDMNKLKNPSFAVGIGQDLWSIRRDGAKIYDRFTGLNGAISRDNTAVRAAPVNRALTLSAVAAGVRTVVANGGNAFTPDMVGRNFLQGGGVASILSVESPTSMTVNVSAPFPATAIAAGAATVQNTASMKVVKNAAAGNNFEVALFTPVLPGERILVHGWYRFPTGGSAMPGVVAANYRWCDLNPFEVAGLAGSPGSHAQVMPVEGIVDIAGPDWDLGAKRSAAVCRTVDLDSSTPGTWKYFVLSIPNDTTGGEMEAPAWARWAEIVLNFNNAGIGVLHITDVTVSAC